MSFNEVRTLRSIGFQTRWAERWDTKKGVFRMLSLGCPWDWQVRAWSRVSEERSGLEISKCEVTHTCVSWGGSHGVYSEKTVGLGTHHAGTPKVCMTTWRRKKRRGTWGKDAGRADCTANKARVLPSEPATVSFQALVPLSVKRWGKQSKNQALYRENYWYKVSYIAMSSNHSDPCPEQCTEDS